MIKWDAVAIVAGIALAVAVMSGIAMRYALRRLVQLEGSYDAIAPRPYRFVFWRRLLVYASGVAVSLIVILFSGANALAGAAVLVSQRISIATVALLCLRFIRRLDVRRARVAAWLSAASITFVSLAALPAMEPLAQYVSFDIAGDGAIAFFFWPVFAPLVLLVMVVYAAIQCSAAMMAVAVALSIQKNVAGASSVPLRRRSPTDGERYEFRPAVVSNDQPVSTPP